MSLLKVAVLHRPRCVRALVNWSGPHPALANERDSDLLRVAAQLGRVDTCRVLLGAPTHAARADARDSVALIAATERQHVQVCVDCVSRPRWRWGMQAVWLGGRVLAFLRCGVAVVLVIFLSLFRVIVAAGIETGVHL